MSQGLFEIPGPVGPQGPTGATGATGATGPAGAGFADGDYGDITISGGVTVLTVDNDAITYAKMQNVSATDKILGRSTAGAGDVEEITCTAAARSLLDDTSTSAMLTTLGVIAAIFTTVARTVSWLWTATIGSNTHTVSVGASNQIEITSLVTSTGVGGKSKFSPTLAEIRFVGATNDAYFQGSSASTTQQTIDKSTLAYGKVQTTNAQVAAKVAAASGYGVSLIQIDPSTVFIQQQSDGSTTAVIQEYGNGTTLGQGDWFRKLFDTDGSTVLCGHEMDHGDGHTFVGDESHGGMVDLDKTLSAPAYTPAQITSNQANLALNSRSLQVRLTSDAARTIFGITAGVDGELHLLHNAGSYDLIFEHESGSATGALINLGNNGQDAAYQTRLKPKEFAWIAYDATSARWNYLPVFNNVHDSRGYYGTSQEWRYDGTMIAYFSGLALHFGGLGRPVITASAGVALYDTTQFAAGSTGKIGFSETVDGAAGCGTYLTRAASGVLGLNGPSGVGGTLSFPAYAAAQVTANQTSWDLRARSEFIRFTSDDDANEIQGMTAWNDGEVRELYNVGSFNLIFKDASGSATGAQLRCTTNADITCLPDGMVRVRYDATSGVFRVSPGF
jgi:hypothetical protein